MHCYFAILLSGHRVPSLALVVSGWPSSSFVSPHDHPPSLALIPSFVFPHPPLLSWSLIYRLVQLSLILPCCSSLSLVGLALTLAPHPPSLALVGPHPPSLALVLPCWPSSSLILPCPPSCNCTQNSSFCFQT